MKVFVYFNLHRSVWSIRALEGDQKGLVIDHRQIVHLKDVTCKVSEAGRQRIIREKRKNVHAGIVGTLVTDTPTCNKPLYYNPYKTETFIYKDTGQVFTKSDYATLISEGRQVLV